LRPGLGLEGPGLGLEDLGLSLGLAVQALILASMTIDQLPNTWTLRTYEGLINYSMIQQPKVNDLETTSGLCGLLIVTARA